MELTSNPRLGPQTLEHEAEGQTADLYQRSGLASGRLHRASPSSEREGRSDRGRGQRGALHCIERLIVDACVPVLLHPDFLLTEKQTRFGDGRFPLA